MAVTNARLGAPPKALLGDRLGTTTYTTSQTYSTTQTVTDKTFTKPDVSDGVSAVTVNGGDVTFEYCTFRNIGDSVGYTAGGYRFGLIDITSGASSVTFNQCVFEDIAAVSAQHKRNDMMHINVDGFTMYQCHVEDVYSDQSIGSYGSGDEGNRCLWFNSSADNVDVSYSTFIRPGRNWVQLVANTYTGTTFDHNVVKGAGLNVSAFEDMFNMYKVSGTSTSDRLTISTNYFADGGPSNSGTALISGDGDGTTNTNWVEVDGNYVVNPGNVGIGMYGGSNSFHTNNTVISDDAVSNLSTGMYVADFNHTNSSIGTPAMDSNTITGNRVYFVSVAPSTTNHYWNGAPDRNTYTNTTISGNTWGDPSLSMADFKGITCTNDSVTLTAGQSASFDLKNTDLSWFNFDTYAIVSGALPTGLSLRVDGVVEGTPTASSGVYNSVYQATNVWGNTDTASLAITIEQGGPQATFAITNPVDGSGNVDSPLVVSGTSPNDGSNGTIEIQVTDVTNATVIEAYGSIAVTYNSSTESWSTDTVVSFPQNGETIEIDARRI